MGRIISETCQTLWTVPSEKGFIKASDSEDEWLTIAAQFYGKWNFSHCLGAIYGKHVLIKAPARSGSNFFKGALLGLRHFLAIESTLKMIKNAFYFTSKALFVLKIFKFLSCFFWSCNKTA